MIDLYRRNIDYLRVSITDRCNLHCRYCLPPGLEAAEKDRERYLTKEEILRVCWAAETIGIHKFKITGGEPLVRPEALEIIRELKALPGTEAVTLTTNGLLLKKALPELQKLSIDGINVSLDTLKPERFSWITGLNRDGRELWSGVLEKLKEGAFMGIPMKINCVPIRGFNEDEILDFVELTRELPVDFKETAEKRGNGPAVYGKVPGFAGYVGFIEALHGKFCSSCNRLRLTSEGFLKPCLYYRRGVDLKALLRGGAGEKELEEALCQAILQKPEAHHFQERDPEREAEETFMARIGG